MSQTLAEMASEAAAQLGDANNAAMLTVMKKGIKRRYAQILRKGSWPEIDRIVSVTVASGATGVGIPASGIHVLGVYNTTTDSPVERVSADRMDSLIGDLYGSTGAIRYYTPEGQRAIFSEPTTSDTYLYIQGGSGDTGTCRVTGFFAQAEQTTYGGTPFAKEASINSTTPVIIVSVSTTDETPFIVESFTKDSDTSLPTILFGSSSGRLSFIGETERSARFTWIRFGSAADAATVLRVNVRKGANSLDGDNDVPDLQGIEDILVTGAVADGLSRNKQHGQARVQELAFMQLVDDYIQMRTEDMVSPRAEGTMHTYRSVWEV